MMSGSPLIDIPDIDVWQFLFDRPKEFPEGKSIATIVSFLPKLIEG